MYKRAPWQRRAIIPRTFPEYKKIDGKTYRRWGPYMIKAQANTEANRLRKEGNLVRLLKHPQGGWEIYYRGNK